MPTRQRSCIAVGFAEIQTAGLSSIAKGNYLVASTRRADSGEGKNYREVRPRVSAGDYLKVFGCNQTPRQYLGITERHPPTRDFQRALIRETTAIGDKISRGDTRDFQFGTFQTTETAVIFWQMSLEH